MQGCSGGRCSGELAGETGATAAVSALQGHGLRRLVRFLERAGARTVLMLEPSEPRRRRREVPAAAAGGPLCVDEGARSCRRTDLARRPCGAAVASAGVDEKWPRALRGGPPPRAAAPPTRFSGRGGAVNSDGTVASVERAMSRGPMARAASARPGILAEGRRADRRGMVRTALRSG